MVEGRGYGMMPDFFFFKCGFPEGGGLREVDVNFMLKGKV